MDEPHANIAALFQAGVALKLETIDVCFLAALEARLRSSSLTSLDESQLRDLFEAVASVTEPDAENIQSRATRAIQRLRDQRLLVRVDGHGLMSAGDYTSTRLASAIAQFFTEDQALTRRSLTVLTSTLAGLLGDVLRAARAARSPADWQGSVIDKLRVTVSDLVSGITLRQQGMDRQQESVRLEIAQDLESQWGESISRCERLLDQTSDTLRELSTVLIEETAKLTGLLADIEQAAARADHEEALRAIRQVCNEVERVGEWGRTRLEAWSEYFQYVHRYLRGVVRLDPDRGITHRMRDGLKSWSHAPWFLVVADPVPYRHLRQPEPIGSRAPVIRPHLDRERAPAEISDAEPAIDPALIAQTALARGSAQLVEVLRLALAEVKERERYVLAGRIAHALGTRGLIRYPRDERWHRVTGDLEAQDWTVDPRDQP